jgi:putative ABC transport system permease protein
MEVISMYIFKNAWRNIRRNKGRNILIGLIIVVIAAACSITLAIRESANDIVTSYREKNKLEATIGMDRRTLMEKLNTGDKTQEQMIEAFNNIKAPTEDEIKKYGDSNYVTSYYYTYDLSMNGKDIKEATDSLVKEKTEVTTNTTTTTNKKTTTSGGNNKRPSGGPPPGFNFGGSSSTTTTTTNRKTTTTKKTTEKIFNEKAQSGTFSLVGYDSYENMKEFISGDYTIIDGEVSSDFNSNNIVISEELATINKLKVGDTITLVSPTNESKSFQAKITGIYKENTDSSSDMTQMYSNSANKIITSINFIKTITAGDTSLTATITPTFVLKDKDSIDKFSEEVKTKGLSEYYTVTTNIEEIEKATESVDNVKVFATTFLLITLIIGAVVLMVINMINIRERKYEIGVLRTVGMKKSKLSMQFMFELLIVAVASLMIGAGIGSYASVPVANKLLENEIANSNSKYEKIGNNFGMPGSKPKSTSTEKTESSDKKEDVQEKPNFNDMNFGVARVNEVKNINAVVDFKVLGKLLGIGIVLTLFSSLASIVAIARFSPLTILKERS